jgi:glycosyltransferase involved in cell wall biosynthesis
MSKRKVVFVMPLYAGTEGRAGGVYNEILLREKLAEGAGYETVFFNPWNDLKAYDKDRDIFHVFMANNAMLDFVQKVKSYGFKVVVSPILDTQWKPAHVRLLVRAIKKIRVLHAHLKSAAVIAEIADAICSRSAQESVMLKEGLGAKSSKIHKILNLPKTSLKPDNKDFSHKLNKILFVGNWGTDRKNVLKLVKAMEFVNAELIIAGSPSNTTIKNEIIELAAQNNRISIRGFLSEEEMISLYREVKVFAMPSQFEGTGLAALDALSYGTNVVFTENGGVKDYFLENSYFVNPYSIASISKGLNLALLERFEPITEEFSSLYDIEKATILTSEMYGNV